MWTCKRCHIKFTHETVECHLLENHFTPQELNVSGPPRPTFGCTACSFTTNNFESIAVHTMQQQEYSSTGCAENDNSLAASKHSPIVKSSIRRQSNILASDVDDSSYAKILTEKLLLMIVNPPPMQQKVRNNNDKQHSSSPSLAVAEKALMTDRQRTRNKTKKLTNSSTCTTSASSVREDIVKESISRLEQQLAAESFRMKEFPNQKSIPLLMMSSNNSQRIMENAAEKEENFCDADEEESEEDFSDTNEEEDNEEDQIWFQNDQTVKSEPADNDEVDGENDKIGSKKGCFPTNPANATGEDENKRFVQDFVVNNHSLLSFNCINNNNNNNVRSDDEQVGRLSAKTAMKFPVSVKSGTTSRRHSPLPKNEREQQVNNIRSETEDGVRVKGSSDGQRFEIENGIVGILKSELWNDGSDDVDELDMEMKQELNTSMDWTPFASTIDQNQERRPSSLSPAPARRSSSSPLKQKNRQSKRLQEKQLSKHNSDKTTTRNSGILLSDQDSKIRFGIEQIPGSMSTNSQTFTSSAITAQSSTLRQHRHKCSQCERGYDRPSRLLAHQLSVHHSSTTSSSPRVLSPPLPHDHNMTAIMERNNHYEK